MKGHVTTRSSYWSFQFFAGVSNDSLHPITCPVVTRRALSLVLHTRMKMFDDQHCVPWTQHPLLKRCQTQHKWLQPLGVKFSAFRRMKFHLQPWPSLPLPTWLLYLSAALPGTAEGKMASGRGRNTPANLTACTTLTDWFSCPLTVGRRSVHHPGAFLISALFLSLLWVSPCTPSFIPITHIAISWLYDNTDPVI